MTLSFDGSFTGKHLNLYQETETSLSHTALALNLALPPMPQGAKWTKDY